VPRPSLAGFKDPSRRPRYLIWTAVAVLVVAAFMVTALGVTSSYWFCANGCHKVQDDTIIAFDRSSHAEISCMACHMPVNADPVTFMLHKMEALGELYLTVTDTYELPLNPHSHVAEEMPSGQCTQCHGPNRDYTANDDIIIDHAVHAENDVTCTTCHNRVAHPEDFELTLAGNTKHEDFMHMEACFRCHNLAEDAKAPGDCSACHPEEFELVPESHEATNFYNLGGESSGHADLKIEEPGYCGICHTEDVFCVDCHGIVMPHPADFKENHGEAGRTSPDVCKNCHARGEVASSAGFEFCNSCHHPAGDPAKPWLPQHFVAVDQSGPEACFACHTPTYCAECHVGSIKP
jgi:hypothetical protein